MTWTAGKGDPNFVWLREVTRHNFVVRGETEDLNKVGAVVTYDQKEGDFVYHYVHEHNTAVLLQAIADLMSFINIEDFEPRDESALIRADIILKHYGVPRK